MRLALLYFRSTPSLSHGSSMALMATLLLAYYWLGDLHVLTTLLYCFTPSEYFIQLF
jgi:hypothetical protein